MIFDGGLFVLLQNDPGQIQIIECGDGYDITLKGSTKTQFGYTFEQSRLQSAYSVALCALEKYNLGEHVSDKTLAPVYLRPSQAERERLERIKNESKENN